MAETIPTSDTSITATYGGLDPTTNEHSYVLENAQSGARKTVTSSYPPEDTENAEGVRKPGFRSLMGVDLQSPAGRELADTLAPSFAGLQYKDERGIGGRILAPVIRSIPAYVAGGLPDVGGLMSYVPGPLDLLAKAYKAVTGDDPFGAVERRRRIGEGQRQTAAQYGTKAQQGRFSQYLRQADQYAQDTFGVKPFEDTVGTDMTPEARGVWEKVLAGALEMGTSGPFMAKGLVVPAKLLQDGAQSLFLRFAKESAEELGEAAADPENVLSLIDKAHRAYSVFNKGGRRNIRQEFTFGAMGGAATEAALDQLQKVDPEAAGWVQTSVAIGTGLLAPLAVRGAVTTLLQGPIVRLATTAIVDPLLRPGRSASSFVRRNLGESSRDRAAVASTASLLEEAIADGRHVNAASGLAFTTPELARTEAGILRAEIQIKRERLSQETDPEVQERLREEIEAGEATVGNFHRTANFYEAVLESAAKDRTPGAAAKFFQDEARRLVERRESFFNFVEGTFKKAYDDLDFGGKPGGTPDELRVDLENARKGGVPEFESNRRTLVMEGSPQGVEASEFLWLEPQTKQRVGGIERDLSEKMDEALAKAQAAANDRVGFLEDSVQLYLRSLGKESVADLPAAERRIVGDLIRGTYDDAAREFRAFEKAAYRRIKGLDTKVTEDIVFPRDSVDPVTGNDISGMTVEEWATSRFDNLSPEEAFNPGDLPPQLAQLAGSRSVVAQMNRRQREAAASGKGSGAEERISNLERRRDDAIAQRDEVDARLNEQRDADRILSEDSERTLQTYYMNAMENLDDAGKKAVADFVSRPDMGDWSGMSIEMAKGLAPKGLQNVFAEITRQRKRIFELGSGVTASKEVRALDKKMEGFAAAAQKAQESIDDITNRFLGVGDDVQVPETGRLTARDADGTLVRGGTSAEDVRSLVADLAEGARVELSANGRTPKYRRIQQTRETIEKLLNSTNFPDLDVGQLNFARSATRVKRTLDDAQGSVLEKTRGSEVKAEVEVVAETVLPSQSSAPAAASKLRLLQEATAEVPDFVTITRGDDGLPVATINEEALNGAESLFNRPDSPFEMVQVGQAGTPFEIRLKPNAPVTERSLAVAEAIILERLALKFPDGVDSKGLESFRKNNKAAIKFLEDNGPPDLPEKRTVVGLLKDADSLALQLDALGNLRRDKTRSQLTELVNRGELDLNGFEIDDYLEYIGQRRKRGSEENAFSEVLGADPGRGMETLFDRILARSNNRPKQDIQEFLSLVRGSKQAERGLQASIIGQIYKRSLTHTDALARETSDLAMQAFDPGKFRELVRNPRVKTIIQEAFPDNPEILSDLEEMAKSAFETSNFTQGSRVLAAVNPAEAVNLTGWAFLGRIAALSGANATHLVNQLWAGGAGSTGGKVLGRRVTGSRIKDILIEAAIDPEKSVELGLRVGQQSNGFWATLGQAGLDTVTTPFKRPGASLSIINRGEQELEDEDGIVGPQTSVQPVIPPVRRMAENAPPSLPVNPASMMNNVSAVGPAPAPRPAGPSSPGMAQRGRDVFGPNDPIFANRGGHVGKRMAESGIMSVERKPRQLVG